MKYCSLFDRGLSVVPLSRSKRPVVKWVGLQSVRAERDVVVSWAECGYWVGIVTGGLSGVVVVDYDHTDVLPVDDTLVVRTPNGFHAYYRHPGGLVSTVGGVRPGVDVRGDGGVVVAAGNPGYEVVCGSWDALGVLPGWVPRRGSVRRRVRAGATMSVSSFVIV